ncbi:MAG: 5-formyltetrahydrofolate cyclo-ligase [Coriobacteriia bacterium]
MTNPGDIGTGAPSSEGDAGVVAAKRAARVQVLSARASLDQPTREIFSADASLRLLDLPELADAGLVLAYAAMTEEIDPLPAVSELRARGVKIAYPRIESSGVLGVHVIDDEAELVPGPFGLSEPRQETPRAELHLIDAVIVPGVAFGENGLRLGYGGGYFDRLLPQLRPSCPRIALAFDEQLLAQLPAEEHDASIDVIVTPTRVIRPESSPTSRRPARRA